MRQESLHKLVYTIFYTVRLSLSHLRSILESIRKKDTRGNLVTWSFHISPCLIIDSTYDWPQGRALCVSVDARIRRFPTDEGTRI